MSWDRLFDLLWPIQLLVVLSGLGLMFAYWYVEDGIRAMLGAPND